MPQYGMIHANSQGDPVDSTVLSTATEKLHELMVPWQCEVESPEQVGNLLRSDSESMVQTVVRSVSTPRLPAKRRRKCCPKLPLSLGICSPRGFKKKSEGAYLDGVENHRERSDAPVSPIWLQKPPQTSSGLANFLAQIRTRLILIERRLYYLTNEKQALLSCLWSISKSETAMTFPGTHIGPVSNKETGNKSSRMQIQQTCVPFAFSSFDISRAQAFSQVASTLPTPVTEDVQLTFPAPKTGVSTQQSRTRLSLWRLTQLTNLGDCVNKGQTTVTQSLVPVGDASHHSVPFYDRKPPTSGTPTESDGPPSIRQGSGIINSEQKQHTRPSVIASSLSPDLPAHASTPSDASELETVSCNDLRSPMKVIELSEALLRSFEDEQEFQKHWETISDAGLRKWLRFFGLKYSQLLCACVVARYPVMLSVPQLRQVTPHTPSRTVMLEELNSILDYVYGSNSPVSDMSGVDTSGTSPISPGFEPPVSKLRRSRHN